MNNKQYNDQRKAKLEINERNLSKVVDYMNAQRKQIRSISEEVLEWKELISKYVKIVTDLQREVEQLRNEVQINRFSAGASSEPTNATATLSSTAPSDIAVKKPKKKSLITDVTKIKDVTNKK